MVALLHPLPAPPKKNREAYGKPGAAPEPLATARARVSTALAGLPKLIADADASELPRWRVAPVYGGMRARVVMVWGFKSSGFHSKGVTW